MNLTDQTQLQLERALRKLAEKFPAEQEASMLTDIHFRVSQDTGELTILDDDDHELTRCVVEEWIKSSDEDFYEDIVPILRSCIENMRPSIEKMSIMQPFSFVLIDEDHETLQDLVIIDSEETVMLDTALLDGLEEDLDSFLKQLLEE